MAKPSASPERVGGQADVLEGVISEDVEGQEGQRDEAADQPREPHRKVGVPGRGGPAGGVEDQLVALQSDEHEGEDGHGHRHALDKGRHLDKARTNTCLVKAFSDNHSFLKQNLHIDGIFTLC